MDSIFAKMLIMLFDDHKKLNDFINNRKTPIKSQDDFIAAVFDYAQQNGQSIPMQKIKHMGGDKYLKKLLESGRLLDMAAKGQSNEQDTNVILNKMTRKGLGATVEVIGDMDYKVYLDANYKSLFEQQRNRHILCQHLMHLLVSVPEWELEKMMDKFEKNNPEFVDLSTPSAQLKYIVNFLKSPYIKRYNFKMIVPKLGYLHRKHLLVNQFDIIEKLHLNPEVVLVVEKLMRIWAKKFSQTIIDENSNVYISADNIEGFISWLTNNRNDIAHSRDFYSLQFHVFTKRIARQAKQYFTFMNPVMAAKTMFKSHTNSKQAQDFHAKYAKPVKTYQDVLNYVLEFAQYTAAPLYVHNAFSEKDINNLINAKTKTGELLDHKAITKRTNNLTTKAQLMEYYKQKKHQVLCVIDSNGFHEYYLNQDGLADFLDWQRADNTNKEHQVEAKKKQKQQDIEKRCQSGELLSIQDLQKIYPGKNISKLLKTYASVVSNVVVQGKYLPAHKLKGFSFVMGLHNSKKRQIQPIKQNRIDLYKVSDITMDNVANSLAQLTIKSERQAIDILIAAIEKEITR